MKVFFVKYNDPIYVKLEKLDIMIRLTNATNIAQVLAELKEYATEVDVDFVRKAVRAIGRCAIKVEQAAERCVSTLIDLIQTKVNDVVQEAIIVIKVSSIVFTGKDLINVCVSFRIYFENIRINMKVSLQLCAKISIHLMNRKLGKCRTERYGWK